MPELVLTARKQAKPGQPIPNLYAIFLCSVQVMVMVLKVKISPEYYLFCWVFCILRLLEWNLLKFGNSAGSPLIKEAEIEL